MKKCLSTLLLAALALPAIADDFDTSKPFGFCTVSSRTEATPYDCTGGGCYTYPVPDGFTGKVIELKSDGPDADMKAKIQNAIKQNDVIILDGSNGDFIISSSIGFERGNKTILGINNARLCTKFYVTDEIKQALNAAGVPSMSTSDGGGTLSNGKTVKEQAEFNTRQIIINLTGDNNEDYQKSGIFSLNKENVIIRNITFVGPGSVDVGGYDLISASGAKYCWVDHCAFSDGMDGNLDITNASNFNTVSYCTFSYTSRSYMHQNTNLVGSSDSETAGTLNTTFAFNWWGTGCNQRMPMARTGKIHMLNNYFSCAGNSTSINPRTNSEFLIEGNYFDTGVKKYYSENGATAVTWDKNNYIAESSTLPASKGSTVTVPYSYSVRPYADVPAIAKAQAGATLEFYKSDEGDEGKEDANYVIDQNTYQAEGSASGKWLFSNDISVTSNGKNYGAGNNNGIKYSAATYTINLPSDASINSITFNGYCNYGDGDGYLSEVNGVSYDATTYLFPKAPDKDNKIFENKSYTISFGSPATGSITFTVKGKQCVFAITLSGKKGTTGIKITSACTDVVATEYYSLDGRKLTEPQRGINIRVEHLSNGQKVTTKVVR